MRPKPLRGFVEPGVLILISPTKKWAPKGAHLILAGGEGFEPPLTESESVVLPLDDPPKTQRSLSERLALRELLGAASLAQTDFLALNFPCVTGDKTSFTQRRAQ